MKKDISYILNYNNILHEFKRRDYVPINDIWVEFPKVDPLSNIFYISYPEVIVYNIIKNITFHVQINSSLITILKLCTPFY